MGAIGSGGGHVGWGRDLVEVISTGCGTETHYGLVDFSPTLRRMSFLAFVSSISVAGDTPRRLSVIFSAKPDQP